MSPEELDELRKSAVVKMVQCIGIQNAAVCRHPYNGVNNASFALVNLPDLLAHIDSQAAQIEALKEKLVEVKAIGLFNSPWDSGLPDGCGYDAEMAACRDEAHQQLKAEMKGVEWE